jgi:hypothetical protein
LLDLPAFLLAVFLGALEEGGPVGGRPLTLVLDIEPPRHGDRQAVEHHAVSGVGDRLGH